MPGMAAPTAEHRDQAAEEVRELRRAQANMRLLLIAGIGLFTLFLVGLAGFLYISTTWTESAASGSVAPASSGGAKQTDPSASEL